MVKKSRFIERQILEMSGAEEAGVNTVKSSLDLFTTSKAEPLGIVLRILISTKYRS